MKTSDTTIPRRRLRPLVRRRVAPAHEASLDHALRELEERAIASSLLPEMVAAQKQARLEKQTGRWTDPLAVTLTVQFAAALYLAHRVSLQEYAFLVAHSAEGVHEARLSEGAYPEIEQLSESMRAVESAYGLKPGEYWLKKDAPPEFRLLGAKWDAASEARLAETLAELEGHTVSAIFATDRSEFDRLRERGRRSFFHKDDLIPALADTVKRYEREARASADAGAFTASVTLIGASVEGLLLLRCLRSRAKSSQVAANLPAKKRPRDPCLPTMWSFDTLIHVCLAAGWLPVIDTPNVAIRPDGLAHQLRQMRNYIHPGRVCTDRPWVEAERRDFEGAQVIYTTLFAAVFKGALLKRYGLPTVTDKFMPPAA